MNGQEFFSELSDVQKGILGDVLVSMKKTDKTWESRCYRGFPSVRDYADDAADYLRTRYRR